MISFAAIDAMRMDLAFRSGGSCPRALRLTAHFPRRAAAFVRLAGTAAIPIAAFAKGREIGLESQGR